MTAWLPDWLTDWLTGWLTDWLPDCLADGLIDGLTDCLTDWLTNCLADWWADERNDHLPEWLTDWMTDWLSKLWMTMWQVVYMTNPITKIDNLPRLIHERGNCKSTVGSVANHSPWSPLGHARDNQDATSGTNKYWRLSSASRWEALARGTHTGGTQTIKSNGPSLEKSRSDRVLSTLHLWTQHEGPGKLFGSF